MYVQLLTKKRELVARYMIPEFHPGPQNIIWGSRTFIKADEELKDVLDNRAVLQQKQRVYNYVEDMTYFLMSTNPTWDVPEDMPNGG